jgi:hypothetical protein
MLSLRERKLKADMAIENDAQIAAQRWTWEQERFFRDEGNKVFRDNPTVRESYNAVLRELVADQENQTKAMAWFLEEAAKVTRERLSQALGVELPAPGGKKPSAPSGRGGGKPRSVPPNIGDMPSADLNETGGNEFSHLDKLSGMELEMALARLSPEEAERYLRS